MTRKKTGRSQNTDNYGNVAVDTASQNTATEVVPLNVFLLPAEIEVHCQFLKNTFLKIDTYKDVIFRTYF